MAFINKADLLLSANIRRSASALACAAILGLCMSASAADLYVPMPYPTIQAAINAAVPGDTVYVTPGTYYENISLNGKDISLRAFNTNLATIIDGGQKGPVITFNGQESTKCIVRDLQIQNGKGTNGGGIAGNSTLATIRNCTIVGNGATSSGGGIFGVSGTIKGCVVTQNLSINGAGIANCEGTIESCQVTNNIAATSGAGLYNCNGVIQYCTIKGNQVGGSGGGIAKGSALIVRNTIDGNKAVNAGSNTAPGSFGAGISEVTGTILANVIINNECNGDGGGINACTGPIQNNVIAFNSARRGGGTSGCDGRVEHNTIWGNKAVFQGGGCFNPGPNTINSIIYANVAPADSQWSGSNVPKFSCVQGWTGGQPDIMVFDPMLVDPAKKNFHLRPDSPCIDAGQLIADLVIDLEWNPRPMDGTAAPRGDGSDYDMGAYEYAVSRMDVAAGGVTAKVKYKGNIPKLKTQLSGNFIVANTGDETIPGTFYAQAYVSFDPVFDPSDLPVGKPIAVKNLKPGKTKKGKFSAKADNIYITGLYVIVVADPGNAIGEVDRSNNIFVYGPLP